MEKKILSEIGKWTAIYDEEGNCTSALYDDAYLKLLGISAEADDVDSQNAWKALVHPDDIEKIDANERELFDKHQEGMDYDLEYRMMTPSGYHWFHDYGLCIRREDGSVSRMDGIIFDIQDIVDNEKAQKKLAENNDRIIALEDNFEVLYDVELDTGNYDIFVKGQSFGDVTRNFINTNSFFDDVEKNLNAVHPDDRQGNYNTTRPDFIRKALSASDHFDRYYRLMVNGKPSWARMRIVYKNSDKKNIIIGVFNADNDVEAKQIAEQKALLEENMQMIGGLADRYDTLYYVNLNDGIFKIYALDGKKYPGTSNIVSGMTDPFEALRRFGTSPIVHPDDQHLFTEINEEYARKRLSDSKRFTIRYRQADGGDFVWFEMEVIKYEDAEKPANALAIGFVNCDQEIRAEQEYHQQLENAKKIADAANQSKTNFLFNMSHDIRTPMNAIRGFTTMAKKNADDKEKVTEYLNKIDISGQQLLTLINQVLEMARIESGKAMLDEKPVNIQEEFNSIVTIISEQAKEKSLRLDYSFSNVSHVHVLGDEAKMSSIAMNIAGNAIKYTPEGGSIEISLKETDGRRPGYATYILTVSDTGIGMSEGYLSKLYEPFSRENSSTVSKIQGTGLGLSIVKSLVDLMGGNIAVQSEPGKGTRFDVTVDLKTDENIGLTNQNTENAEMVSFKGRRVLLVEDNEMNREIARDILEEQGIIVEDAEDGDIAVAMIQAIADRKEYDYYDFILMDVQMPRMNGYEASRAIRAIPGPEGTHIPIIAMTANAFEEDRKNALDSGMDEHLAKPINVQILFKTIARFLK